MGVHDPKLHAFLSKFSTVEKSDWSDRLPDIQVWRSQTLVVFDLAYLQALDDEVPPAVKVIILVPEKAEAAAVQQVCLRFPFPVFYYSDNSPSWDNLHAHLMLLSQDLLSDHRLNAYIVDSFKEAVNMALLEQQKEEIRRMNAELERLAKVDYLTNLLNRRALLEAMEAEKLRALRHRWRLDANGDPEPPPPLVKTRTHRRRPEGLVTEHLGQFSCHMVDIDHFKLVNDQHGHLVGDEVLRRFSEIAREKGMYRETDILGRFGGEEFIILLPETNLHNASIPAERLRQRMEETVFKDHNGRDFQVTISIGVAQFHPEERACEELIERADEALYYAKENGRNQVVLYDQGTFVQGQKSELSR